jgi:hypothetical protein
VVDPWNFGAPSLVIHKPEWMSLKYIRPFNSGVSQVTEQG